jgi:pilus assembly protein CpaB
VRFSTTTKEHPVGRRVALLTAAIVIAAIGTTLVYLYAKQANDRAIADASPVDVLAASAPIPAGTSIEDAVTAGSVEPQSLPQKSVPEGAVARVEDIAGQVAVTTIPAGQTILTTLFGDTADSVTGIRIPEGKLAASFAFDDTARVAGFVNAGNEVAVFLTSEAASPDAQPTTRLLLERVMVLAVGNTTASPPADPNQANPEATPRTTLTLAVTQEELEALVFAQTQGELYLGLRDEASQVGPSRGVNVDNLFE